MNAIADIHAQGLTRTLAAQSAALTLADIGYVMRQGEIIFSGPAAELCADPAMLRHYLGD